MNSRIYFLLTVRVIQKSCERLFRPTLEGVPVVVLSNNDGCAIARSNEAKSLRIKMGAPWHLIKHLEDEAGLVALSANFSLYSDMSDRMMSVAAGLGPTQEIYSIDESFIGLDGVGGDLKARAMAVRDRILRWVGIPCCVGIGATKTLSKFANHVAKQAECKPGSYPAEHAKVCDLSNYSRVNTEELLAATEVGEVWGVGRKISAGLMEGGVRTALDLARLDPATAKRGWSVALERTVRELQGTACIGLEDHPEPKRQIACTRSFGRPVEALAPMAEAVSEFASRTAEKLRGQGSFASEVLVFIRTSPFRQEPQYSRAMVVPLRRPSSDTSAIVGAALMGLRAIYKSCFKYAKAGVMLMDIGPSSREQFELDLGEPQSDRDRSRLMKGLDAVNDRWGRGPVKVASGKVGPVPREWGMRQERKTPAHTTEWDEMPTAKA